MSLEEETEVKTAPFSEYPLPENHHPGHFERGGVSLEEETEVKIASFSEYKSTSAELWGSVIGRRKVPKGVSLEEI